MTNQILIPTDDEFVEAIAKSIAYSRWQADTTHALEDVLGIPLSSVGKFEDSFDRIFEVLWNGKTPADERQKDAYRADARAAIAAINLKLLTTS